MSKILLINSFFALSSLVFASCVGHKINNSSSTPPAQDNPNPNPSLPQQPPIDNPPTNPLIPQQVLEISIENNFTNIVKGENNSLLAINNKNELHRFKDAKWTKIADNINQHSPILEHRNRISVADVDGNYVMIQGNQVTKTNIKVSLLSSFVHLGAANILVVKENNKYFLARVELNNVNSISSINRNISLLPDSKPVQISLGSSDNSDGFDIAVLAQPSTSSDYQHGVLGDNIEAKRVFMVERHNMNDVRGDLTLSGKSVFEESRLLPLKIQNKYYLATVQSGENNRGAQVAIIAKNSENKLEIVSKGPQLGSGRWMSIYTINDNKLFSTHTPHIGGSTFLYNFDDLKNVKTEEFSSKISTHKISSFVLSVTDYSNKFLFAPSKNFNSLVATNLNDKNAKEISLGSTIIKIITANENSAYVLLTNNTIVQVNFIK